MVNDVKTFTKGYKKKMGFHKTATMLGPHICVVTSAELQQQTEDVYPATTGDTCNLEVKLNSEPKPNSGSNIMPGRTIPSPNPTLTWTRAHGTHVSWILLVAVDWGSRTFIWVGGW